MSHFHYQRQFIGLLAALSTCGMSACGGGTPAVDDVSDAEMLMTPMKMSGTIVVEERNGKTVLDGWFAQNIVGEQAPAIGAANSGKDDCIVNSVNIDSVLASPHETNSTDWTELKSLDGTAGIKSRAGDFESLVKQSAGDTTVYAPNERWQSDALPDDAVLSFDADSFFGKIDGVDVQPLRPLVWSAPETGVLSSAAAPLKWEASSDDEVRIKLKLSAIDFRSSENPTVTSIDCNLIDDGEFNLSTELQQQLPDDHTGIVVYAVRERVQLIENDETSLTVVQLSYPAPVNP